MSGLARAAKKHWKRKVKLFKKYWKVVAIAVVAYFTMGLALGAMAPAAGTVAAGSGAAASGAGVMTATGAAATGTAATGAAAAAAGIETVTVTAAAAGGVSAAGAGAAAVSGGVAAANMAGKPTGDAPNQQPVKPAQAVPPQESTSLMAKAKGAWKDMTFSDKLLLAKSGVDVVSAATAPSPEEEAAAAAKWQGAFYGFDAKGADQFVKQQGQATKVQQGTAPKQGTDREIVAANPMAAPGESPVTPMQAPQRMDFQSTAQQPEAQEPAPEAEQVTNMGNNRDLFAQRAKGVRYLV